MKKCQLNLQAWAVMDYMLCNPDTNRGVFCYSYKKKRCNQITGAFSQKWELLS